MTSRGGPVSNRGILAALGTGKPRLEMKVYFALRALALAVPLGSLSPANASSGSFHPWSKGAFKFCA